MFFQVAREPQKASES